MSAIWRFFHIHHLICDMINLKGILQKSTFIILCIFLVLLNNSSSAQDGKALFNTNCASCHAIDKNLTGPALRGVEDRWADKELLHEWIHNSSAVIAKGDPYAVNLFNEYGKVTMPGFPQLSTAEIDAILSYVESAPAPGAAAPGAAVAAPTETGDNTLLYGILTLILAIVAFVLLQVNANLRKLADDKAGVPAHEPVPFWRNKVYITMVTLILFLIGGYYVVKGAIGLGHTQNYQPEQPIFYSHKVHAGINQISCLYCHNGAEDGRHANIPSVNICMNCHLAINEYTGTEKLVTADGNEVDGTHEIQKLYKYAGYESGKPWDPSMAKPVEWVQIHNLPDHVYFNHSQHIMVGKVQCQTCHGEIQNMHEVKQFAPLSMGWCINCHRETKVDFNDNGFYSIYEKYHDDIKNGTLDTTKGITVENIGGTECQKCHY